MGITEAQKKQLDEQGCIVIPDVLSDEEIEVYRTDILRLAEEEKQSGLARQHTDGHGQHVRWLVNKGEMYEQLVARPKVMPYFEHLLGPDYTLSTLTSNIIDPGAPDGGYHVDSVLGGMPEPAAQFLAGCQQSLVARRFHTGERGHTTCAGDPSPANQAHLPALPTTPMKFDSLHRKAPYFSSTVRSGTPRVPTKPIGSVLR